MRYYRSQSGFTYVLRIICVKHLMHTFAVAAHAVTYGV